VFNWLWILIILAVIMILLICVTVCCVYRKKFTHKESKKDAKHGHLTFGQMNVESKVKWHGKNKGKASKSAASKKTMKDRSASKARAGSASRQKTSKTRAKTVKKSTKASDHFIGAHAGK